MAFKAILGEVSQGRGAGLNLYGVNSSLSSGWTRLDYLYNHTCDIEKLALGKEEGFFKKYVEKESISLDDIVEVKKASEVGNDVYFQLKYSNGDVSAIKTYKNVRLTDNMVGHPASAITELFITKFVG